MKNEAARLRAGADALSAAKDVVFAALAAVWRPKKWRKLRRRLLTARRRPWEAHLQHR